MVNATRTPPPRLRTLQLTLAPAELPVFFFSHGSTAMLQNRTAAAAYWEQVSPHSATRLKSYPDHPPMQVGRQALEQGVERIVMMGAHWETMGEKILVSANPNPPKQPVAW
jgi:aromatic ring-opening dioxygenase catalytic subunit (LigB family)